MKTRRPIDAKNTSRILRAILPPNFKMVNDKSSNGYKFTNLLYGVEIDFAREKLQSAYDNSYIDTFDLSDDGTLYEVRFSGIPNGTHLTSNEGSIKITSENEFYNGDPTRVRQIDSIPLDSGTITGGVIGLNYFRKDYRGSGYLLVNVNRSQEESYLASIYPSYRIELTDTFDSEDDLLTYSGFYTGIATQSYAAGATDEVLTPLDAKTLSGKYPLKRRVLDESGVYHNIDHYEPYLGWVRDETGTVMALVDYSGTYYYNSNGKKIYYRTALNNPYGYNNYNTAYMDLRFVPISGTLKVYDIDILDGGEATLIPNTGKTLYYLQSDRMNVSGSGEFDPTYLGYSATVPLDHGFSDYMEGKSANFLKTTSWDYLHEGGGINEESHVYLDGSGAITNRIKIKNPHSRYLVEYKYKLHDYSRYTTSLDAAGYVNNDTQEPVYSLENTSGNLILRDYEFTKDPRFVSKDSEGNTTAYQNSKRLTFDGLDVRPGKSLFKIDCDIPLIISAGPLQKSLSVNANKYHIGYSRDYVPTISVPRNYYLNCPFDEPVSGSVIERDITGNSTLLTFQNTGTASIHRINYGTHYGKKIIKGSGDSYFQRGGTALLSDYVHIAIGCKLRYNDRYDLIEFHDNTRDRYLEFTVISNGIMIIRMDGYKFNSINSLTFNNYEKEFIVRYKPDIVSSAVPYVELFYRSENDLGFKEAKLFRAQDTAETVTANFIRCFKNCSVDIDYLKVYNEVF